MPATSLASRLTTSTWASARLSSLVRSSSRAWSTKSKTTSPPLGKLLEIIFCSDLPFADCYDFLDSMPLWFPRMTRHWRWEADAMVLEPCGRLPRTSSLKIIPLPLCVQVSSTPSSMTSPTLELVTTQLSSKTRWSSRLTSAQTPSTVATVAIVSAGMARLGRPRRTCIRTRWEHPIETASTRPSPSISRRLRWPTARWENASRSLTSLTSEHHGD